MIKRVPLPPDFTAWRKEARIALQEGFAASDIHFEDLSVPATIPLALEAGEESPTPTGAPVLSPHVPRSFLEAAETASAHRSPERWDLLYRLLFRLQENPDLLKIEIDSDVAQLRTLENQVRRDLHKMHAFVRFRKVVEDDAIEEANPFAEARTPEHDRAHYVAWYQPDHRILPLAAPFFAERFAVMHWSILTPDGSVAWDPEARLLHFGPPVLQEHAPSADELETLWRTYYASIFNPARINPEAMRSEMPVRYWKNLPEVTLLPDLMIKSASRVGAMMQSQQAKSSAAPFVPQEHTIALITAALPSCKGCDLYLHATQAVPGVGPSVRAQTRAELMLVGEQPGDKEDLQGLPFVGPAGRVLDQIMEELGIDRSDVFVTNAVKHFKFVQHGKLRLHQNPRMGEITACRPWLLAEIDAVRPRVVLCLGASAAKSLLGGTFGLMKERGKVLSTPYADQVMATIHPSAVLRARDEVSREQLYGYLKQDLERAHQAANGNTPRLQPDATAL